MLNEFYDVKIAPNRSTNSGKTLLRTYNQITQILNKSVYKNPEELIRALLDAKEKLVSKRETARLIRIVVRHAWEIGFLNAQDKARLDRELVPKKDKLDNYVPTENEIRGTLNALPPFHQKLYLSLLYSGARIIELEYCYTHSIPYQQMEGFVKYDLNWTRGKKSAIFVYLPKPLEPLDVEALKKYIKTRNLLPMKYLRKFFYTRAIATGCPSEVADFIQGRVQNSVGGRHYLAVQQLADTHYGIVCEGIRRSI